MEKVNPYENITKGKYTSFYLPHHAVVKPDKKTTKVNMDVEMHEAKPTPTLRSTITVSRSAAPPVSAPRSSAPRTATAPAAALRNVTPRPAAAPTAPPRVALELPQRSPSEMQGEYAAAAAPASRASAWVLPQLLGAIPRNEGMRLPHQVPTMRQTASHAVAPHVRTSDDRDASATQPWAAKAARQQYSTIAATTSTAGPPHLEPSWGSISRSSGHTSPAPAYATSSSCNRNQQRSGDPAATPATTRLKTRLGGPGWKMSSTVNGSVE
ncbi:PREDICTED: translation initiation factor IF-2-like [Rhagoletis zephyria]|uniref:translation initiation factor IF-2-like n=1 Tax=Rhagoletis zephyria TaxID=28612 RepID=UPI0008112E03|nr:PREDICTED: translation initiation factor IF-2-like [Rhagoletis zephyria]